MTYKIFNKNSESGRSLIEIIAILIILAILLLAALLGFKTLLDYLKTRQTNDEVATIATRVKAKKLQGRKAGKSHEIKHFYPEGSPCSPPAANCVSTPDGGNLKLVSEDTSSFAIVVSDIQCVSCRAIIEMGAFDMYAPEDIKSFDATGYTQDDTEVCTPAKIKDATEKGETDNACHIDKICANACQTDETYKNNHPEECARDSACLVDTFSLIYGNDCKDAKYLVNGQCSHCKKNKIKAVNGKNDVDPDGCCASNNVDKCGYCGGCPNVDGVEQICSDKGCVECTDSDRDCKDKNRTKEICPDGSDTCAEDEKITIKLPYCINGVCSPCNGTVNTECVDASGTKIGLFCDSYTGTCKKKCNKCFKPSDADPGKCVRKPETFGTAPGNECSTECDDSAHDCTCPLVCSGGSTGRCKCPHKDFTSGSLKCVEEGGCCNDAICSNACCDGFMCKDGACVPKIGEEECKILLGTEQNERTQGKSCTSDCPCAGTYLECMDGVCDCKNKPSTPDVPCFEECGCSNGLVCTLKLGSVQETCQCKNESKKMGDECTKDCPCPSTKTTLTNGTKVALFDCPMSNDILDKIRDLFNPSATLNTCQCNPDIEPYSLPSGSACVVGCNQCENSLPYLASH